jgi:uncharacterized protein (DUF305 family)
VKRSAWRFVVLLFLASAITTAAPQEVSSSHGDMAMGGADWSALMSSMERMDGAMSSVKETGDSDIDFARLMLPHHQAAIDMAKTQLLYGKDPKMRRLAQEIITDQQSEIELMQLWLKQHRLASANK